MLVADGHISVSHCTHRIVAITESSKTIVGLLLSRNVLCTGLPQFATKTKAALNVLENYLLCGLFIEMFFGLNYGICFLSLHV